MTVEQRKMKLQEIQSAPPVMTGLTLTYHGERKSFNAYSIPLDFLVYNPYNGRVGSVVKSYERQHHKLDPDNIDDVAQLEKFLWESKPDANERTMQSLLTDHQQRYGIVTADGKIIDGNRRASLLNRIRRNPKIPENQKAHANFFTAVILPIDADKKEILRLETTYQMGEDAKVDYGPIEKYLKAGDLSEAGFTNREIASFMGLKEKDINGYLNVLALMNDYLHNYKYDGIYTVLQSHEDSFLKLESALRAYSSGNVAKMWEYDPEDDVSDLKCLAFDYIRFGLEQGDFRDIIRTPRSTTDTSIFSNKEIWKKFSQRHFDAMEVIEEKDVDELIRENPEGDISRLLRARDNAWSKKVGDVMSENFAHAREKLTNVQNAAEPVKLIRRALEALSAVDTRQGSFRSDGNIKRYIDEIGAMICEFKDALKDE